MKPLAAAPLLATLIALPLQATPLREDALLSIGARTSGWQAEVSGNLDTSVSLGADGLDVHRDIAQQMTLFIEHTVPLLPNLQVRDTRIQMSGFNDFSGNLLGTGYNELVDSRLDLSHTDLTLYWTLPLPVLDISLGMTSREYYGEVDVFGPLAGTTHVDLDFNVPMAYGQLRLNLPQDVYLVAEGNYGDTGDARVQDYSYAIGYWLPSPVLDIGAEIGYRSMRLQTSATGVGIDSDLEVAGAYLGCNIGVSF